MSIMYTPYSMQVYSIRGGYPNQLLNRLAPLVPHLVTPILMVFDLQTNSVALNQRMLGWYYLWHLTTFTHERLHP